MSPIRRQGPIPVLLVGAGPHARRTFIPHVLELAEGAGAEAAGLELAGVVELADQRAPLEAFFRNHPLPPSFVWTEPFTGEELPPVLREALDHLVAERSMLAVLISTPPEVHKPYAAWAIERGLHVVMDKPITTRRDAATDPLQARRIWQDYLDLAESYRQSQSRGVTAFTINAHRRYHATYRTVAELIREVRDKTGCPLTSIYCSHCDGQWRLPAEIVDLGYHGSNQGFGKASHSGYHFFDTAAWFYREGRVEGKQADRAEIHATFVEPPALLHHLHEADYRRLFPDYDQVRGYGEHELRKLYAGHGEIDVYADVALRRAGDVVCHMTFHLLHNSFSQRGWARPNLADLYKGNGRVRHEYHSLQQGPFQNLQIHSFQTNARQGMGSAAANTTGGANHWEIHVFRNEAMLGPPAYRRITIDDLVESRPDRLVVEEIKKGALLELVDFVRGRIGRADLKSNLDDHVLAPALMSGIYQAHIAKTRGRWPVVVFDLSARRFLDEQVRATTEVAEHTLEPTPLLKE